MLCAYRIYNGLYACCNIGGITLPIVSADHDRKELGFVALKLAVGKAPEDILRPVAAIAKIENTISLLQLGKQLTSLATLALPAVSN